MKSFLKQNLFTQSKPDLTATANAGASQGSSSPRTMPLTPAIQNQGRPGQFGQQVTGAILGAGQILGIIGSGSMVQSLLFPLFDSGSMDPLSVIVSGSSEGVLESWKSYGCRITIRNEVVLRESNIVIWAVKPLAFPTLVDSTAKDLSGKPLKDGALHISIMAGLTLDRFVDKIKRGFSLSGIQNHVYQFKAIRVVPNVALQVATGITVFSSSLATTDADKDLIFSLFQPFGLCYDVPESQINAYCALLTSGIGFMCPIVEALSDGAVKLGLPRATSLEMAAQVLKGAGELLLRDNSHPAILKDKVCSPGGTAIAGIVELEKGGLRSIIMAAIEASANRGDEMASRT